MHLGLHGVRCSAFVFFGGVNIKVKMSMIRQAGGTLAGPLIAFGSSGCGIYSGENHQPDYNQQPESWGAIAMGLQNRWGAGSPPCAVLKPHLMLENELHKNRMG